MDIRTLQGVLCPIEQPSGKRHRERAGRRLTQSISTRHRKGTVSVNPARLVRQRKEGTGRLRFLTREEYDALRKVIAKRFSEHVATSENQPLISRGWIQPKSFILLVPGGGSNPHDRNGRRILSLILGVLQALATRRIEWQQMVYLLIDISLVHVAI